MSRTYAHTPLHVLRRRDPRAAEVHRGCVHDPSGVGRIVGYRTEEIVHPAHFGTRIVTTHGEVPKGSRRCTRDGEIIDFGAEDDYAEIFGFRYRRSSAQRNSFFARCESTDCDGEEPGLREHFFFRLDGFLETYTETRRVPVREVVPCDISDGSVRSFSSRRCYVDADLTNEEYRVHGASNRCHCLGCYGTARREREDRIDRTYFRRAAAEYNTFGELEDFADEPHRTP